MPVESLYPRLDIPDVDIWALLFERKDRPYPDDKVIFIDNDTGRSLTYAETKAASIDFGKGLVAAWEWQRGDVLVTYLSNSIDSAPVTWGAHWAGAVVSPANPNYTVDELVYQLKGCGAKGLVTQLAQLDRAQAAAAEAGIPADRIILAGDARDPARAKHFTSIRTTSGTSRYRRARRRSSDLAFLVYSSGTTGLPKGVMLSHGNIVANVLQQSVAEGGNLAWQEDKILAFLPFFHIYGLTCCLHQALRAGWTLVVMPAFAIDRWCAAVQEHKITFSYVVPPVVLQLSKHEVVSRYDLSSLRMLNSGAAPLTHELVDAASARVGCPIKQGYGLSETAPTTHTQPWDRWRTTVGSVGTMLPNMTAKIIGDDGETEVPLGQAGELWLKGPNVFMGYLNNEAGTRDAMAPGGYFKTGDVVVVDDQGNFTITDRVKELIKYKGFQVPPAELEGVLLGHPSIDDAAVLGLYDDGQATELPRAYVVPKQGEQKNQELAKRIADFVAGKVAPHKRLRGGVFFVDEIPKSASGKILRRVLKARALEQEKGVIKAKL